MQNTFLDIPFQYLFHFDTLKMIASTSISILLASVTLSFAKPLEVQPRTVAALNTAAFQEAQQRDDTATRLFSSTTIKVGFSRMCIEVPVLTDI